MFGLSGEHILVLGIILLFFGPRRLPELGNTLGKSIRNFKDAVSLDPPRAPQASPQSQLNGQAAISSDSEVVEVASESANVKESTATV